MLLHLSCCETNQISIHLTSLFFKKNNTCISFNFLLIFLRYCLQEYNLVLGNKIVNSKPNL